MTCYCKRALKILHNVDDCLGRRGKQSLQAGDKERDMKKLFLFDIDGTIAIDDDLLDGTVDLLHYIDRIGGKAIFITNNSTKSRKAYIEKFARWQIPTVAGQFITASYASVVYLRKHHRQDKIFVLGTASLVAELREEGFLVTEEADSDTDAVLVGFDNELTYSKVEKACRLLLTHPDMPYLATNPDLCCPTRFGSVPDCGAICRLLECAVKRSPVFLGKPNPIIVDICLAQTGFTREETLVVGDRLYTDIACGINGGVDTAVVFTGEASPEDCIETEYKPTYQFASVRELYRWCMK